MSSSARGMDSPRIGPSSSMLVMKASKLRDLTALFILSIVDCHVGPRVLVSIPISVTIWTCRSSMDTNTRIPFLWLVLDILFSWNVVHAAFQVAALRVLFRVSHRFGAQYGKVSMNPTEKAATVSSGIQVIWNSHGRNRSSSSVMKATIPPAARSMWLYEPD